MYVQTARDKQPGPLKGRAFRGQECAAWVYSWLRLLLGLERRLRTRGPSSVPPVLADVRSRCEPEESAEEAEETCADESELKSARAFFLRGVVFGPLPLPPFRSSPSALAGCSGTG